MSVLILVRSPCACIEGDHAINVLNVAVDFAFLIGLYQWRGASQHENGVHIPFLLWVIAGVVRVVLSTVTGKYGHLCVVAVAGSLI